MKTPAGRECRYFYGDYFRGKDREECRLLNSANPPLDWQEKLCYTCPVPGIMRANSCENMRLIPSLVRPFPIIGAKQVYLKAHCIKIKREVIEPQIGCGQCHQLPEVFLQEK
jgi:hypothetical protein